MHWSFVTTHFSAQAKSSDDWSNEETSSSVDDGSARRLDGGAFAPFTTCKTAAEDDLVR